MNTKVLLIAPLTALLLGVGGASLAADNSNANATAMPNESGMMRAEAQYGNSSRMSHMMQGGMRDGGMMGMMGACPMMGALNGPNGKVMMQMHGEMMRAMGDIMIKYADKFEGPAASK